MRFPRKRRRQRVWCWEGVVEGVCGDTFWATITQAQPRRDIDFTVELDLNRLPGATPGLFFHIYLHRRGRKTRTVIRPRYLPALTAEQIAEVRARAAELARAWLGHVDNSTPTSQEG